MSASSHVSKRRAAAAAVLALLAFLLCQAGINIAWRLQADAQNPAVDLQPLVRELSKTTDTNARQRALETLARERPAIAAALVAGPDDRVQAAYPPDTRLIGRNLQQPIYGHPKSLRFGTDPYGPGGPSWGGRSGGAPPGWTTSNEQAARRYLVQGHLSGLLLRGLDSRTVTPRVITEPLEGASGEAAGFLGVRLHVNETVYRTSGTARALSILGAVFSFLIYWVMLPLWVFLDARSRTERAVPLAVFVLLTNFLGWLTYLVIRPEANHVCPSCIMFLEPGFRICPVCGWNGDARCRQCRRPLRAHWRFCPYCEAPRAPVAADTPQAV